MEGCRRWEVGEEEVEEELVEEEDGSAAHQRNRINHQVLPKPDHQHSKFSPSRTLDLFPSSSSPPSHLTNLVFFSFFSSRWVDFFLILPDFPIVLQSLSSSLLVFPSLCFSHYYLRLFSFGRLILFTAWVGYFLSRFRIFIWVVLKVISYCAVSPCFFLFAARDFLSGFFLLIHSVVGFIHAVHAGSFNVSSGPLLCLVPSVISLISF